jgi:hypothetical protein
LWSARLVMPLASVMAAAMAGCSSTQESDIGGHSYFPIANGSR